MKKNINKTIAQENEGDQTKCAVCNRRLTKRKIKLCGRKACRLAYRRKKHAKSYTPVKNEPKICKVCDEKFIPKNNTRLICYKRACIVETQREKAREQRERNGYTPVERAEKECLNCGSTFVQANVRQMYCNDETCRKEVAREVAKKYRNKPSRVYKKTCKLCGKAFKPAHKAASTCKSKACMEEHSKAYEQAERYAEKHYIPVSYDDKECKYCGVVFTPKTSRSTHCGSNDCVIAYRKEYYKNNK